MFVIQDPAISIEEGYDIYTEGKQEDIYIKWSPDFPDYEVCRDCADDHNNMLGYVIMITNNSIVTQNSMLRSPSPIL